MEFIYAITYDDGGYMCLHALFHTKEQYAKLKNEQERSEGEANVIRFSNLSLTFCQDLVKRAKEKLEAINLRSEQDILEMFPIDLNDDLDMKNKEVVKIEINKYNRNWI